MSSKDFFLRRAEPLVLRLQGPVDQAQGVGPVGGARDQGDAADLIAGALAGRGPLHLLEAQVALVLEAETFHACTSLLGKPKRLPEELVARLKHARDREQRDQIPEDAGGDVGPRAHRPRARRRTR